MFMIILCLILVVFCLFIRYFEEHMNFAYSYSVILKKITKGNEIFANISFFRTNESYSSKRDVEKMLNGHLEYGGEEQLYNAIQQEKRNNSQRVRQIRKKQRKQEMKRNLRRAVKSLHMRDYLTLFTYLGLPIVCILLLNCPKVSIYFDEIINGISNHRVDIYLSQLSLTFITISLMSIFSDTNAIILWENIVKKTLIEPPASCFKAYFSYSFIYLLFSTVAIMLQYDIGIGVLFAFNILCLFDLSRTMINCYYDPVRKKKKVTNDFIYKIEEANLESLKRSFDNTPKEYVSEVKSTFEDFNYYINDAFIQGKYSDVRDYLAVYGKLLAHVDAATIEANDITVGEWYHAKTHKAYRDLVKNYYTECNSIVLGLSNTNSQPLSMSGRGIERNIINKLLVNLANDIPDVHEVNDIYNLILYALYTHILFIARNVDVDNFDEYLIEREDELKEKLKNGISKLINIFEQDSNMNKISFLLEKSCFELAIVITVGNIAIINSEDILLLEMDFLCWDELKSRKEMREKVKKYVEENTRTFSDERKTKCLRRVNEIFVSMERE